MSWGRGKVTENGGWGGWVGGGKVGLGGVIVLHTEKGDVNEHILEKG